MREGKREKGGQNLGEAVNQQERQNQYFCQFKLTTTFLQEAFRLVGTKGGKKKNNANQAGTGNKV